MSAMMAAADDQVGFCVYTCRRARVAGRRCLVHIAYSCRQSREMGRERRRRKGDSLRLLCIDRISLCVELRNARNFILCFVDITL